MDALTAIWLTISGFFNAAWILIRDFIGEHLFLTWTVLVLVGTVLAVRAIRRHHRNGSVAR